MLFKSLTMLSISLVRSIPTISFLGIFIYLGFINDEEKIDNLTLDFYDFYGFCNFVFFEFLSLFIS